MRKGKRKTKTKALIKLSSQEYRWAGCRGLDLNQCIPKESDLQSDAFDHSATSANFWSRRRDSNS